jgi:hypothetical protein
MAGNAFSNIELNGCTGEVPLRLLNGTIDGDATYTVGGGITYEALGTQGQFSPLRLEAVTMGGITTHTTADIRLTAGAVVGDIILVNSVLSSTTEISNTDRMYGRSGIHQQRVDGTTAVHQTTYPQFGVVSRDTSVFRSASPSEKLAPSGCSSRLRLRGGPRLVPITSGTTVSVSCYVRKDSSYTGSAARLVQIANTAIGVTADTVLDTHTAAADVWQRLSGTTAAASEDGVCTFVVEVDGSAGAVYVDDWSAVENT